ncbi:MAG TPA: hypothetical protein VGO67_03070 [Verrucomicrobiae bacterium]|jgi:hypothetical protein
MNAIQRAKIAEEFAARYDAPAVAIQPADAATRLSQIEAMLNDPANEFDFATRQQMRDEMFDIRLDIGLLEQARHAGQ